MITLPGYQITEHLYESANSLIYRATRHSDHRPVILKTLKEYYPTPNELIRYRQEYELTFSLHLPGVIRAYDLEKYRNTLVIILEDFGGESLKYFLTRPFVSKEFLKLALPIAEGLGQLHMRQVIHKDINPANIVWNPNSREVKIIDLGISTRLSKEKLMFKSPQHLEGTLAYLSPEQTGRMNRDLDYRTDFYSLGVTFYELLTGQLPFTASEPLELLHCHLAKPALPPHHLNPQVPPILSNIVMKLLAKNAEERYQSAFGLKADLAQCLAHVEGLEDFTLTLAQADTPEKLNLPQKLYGRDQEIQTLLTSFERINQGATELVLVTGYSGVGKSSIVHEVHKPITAKAGYFISGKFDQYQRHIPYSAFVSAFNQFCHEILSENPTRIAQWREKILTAIGSRGQILIEVIPALEYLIGSQPAVEQVGPQEAQNRFILFIQRFIQAICQAEHPLVLFIDDWQWADFASIQVLKNILINPALKHCLIVGAYRDNEVDVTHPFFRSLEELRQQHVTLHTIEVSPLALPEVEALLAETFHSSSVQALAKLVHEKTLGNAFFIKTFLQTLYEEELFSFINQQWQWDLDSIHQKALSDDVIELLILQLQKLPPATQEVLRLAANIGNSFDFQLLPLIYQHSPSQTLEALWPALYENLVVPLDEHYKWVNVEDRLEKATFRFQHDRIQQAAYTSISNTQRAALHRQIGLMLLLRHFSPTTRDKAIFEIVNHLNAGFRGLQDWQDLQYSTPQEVAQLNLQAGQKAKASAAYASSLHYLQIGLTLLTKTDWEQHYSLALSLHTEAAEIAYLNGEYVLMEKWSEMVLSKANTLLDKVKIYEVNIAACAARGEYTKAIDTGLFALSILGIKLPSHPTQRDVFWALLQIKWKLLGTHVEKLTHLPILDSSNLTELAIQRLIMAMVSTSYVCRPLLFPILIITSLLRVIKYGRSPLVSFVYAFYGVLLYGLDQLEIGYHFSQLAKTELAYWRDKRIEGPTNLLIAIFKHWKEPLKESLLPLQEVYQSCLETGNLEWMSYSLQCHGSFSYYTGKNLIFLKQELDTYLQTCYQFNQERITIRIKAYYQLVSHLLGHKDIHECGKSLILLSLQNYDYVALAYLYLTQLIRCFLFGDFSQARKIQEENEKYLAGLRGNTHLPIFHLYSALLFLTLHAQVSPPEQKTFLKKVKRYQRKMKNWAHHAPRNYLNKYLLVEAELARVLGKHQEAREYYDQAIAKAHENEFIHEEALANELAGKFYLDREQTSLAQFYLRQAHRAYSCWGAQAKVKDLETRHPQYVLQTDTQTISVTTTTAQGLSSHALELTSILKASQAISKEIDLSRLLEKLITVVLENAGAQRCCLILEKHRQWVIEADGTLDNMTLLHASSLAGQVPLTLVEYVLHTQKNVVLHDAVKKGQFTQDSYILAHDTHSVLCLPLLNQGQLLGLLYLENNVTKGAFTPERLELLNLLASQIVISIENARFYTHANRFVPKEFLSLLDKKSFVETELGDQIEKEMTVLFSDLRGFTTISETMTPKQNFDFINAYLSQMDPVIHQYHGFIDKYIGDAIMALFPRCADDALAGSIAMLKQLAEYNQERVGRPPIAIGVGLNTGILMLGMVGGENRMDGTVISDAVNLASRIEGLTKRYGAKLLISEYTYSRLKEPFRYAMRPVDIVKVKGRNQAPVTIYEVFEGDQPEIIELKRNTLAFFHEGLTRYYQKDFEGAKGYFQKMLATFKEDVVAQIYLERCERYQQDVPEGWDGVEVLKSK